MSTDFGDLLLEKKGSSWEEPGRYRVKIATSNRRLRRQYSILTLIITGKSGIDFGPDNFDHVWVRAGGFSVERIVKIWFLFILAVKEVSKVVAISAFYSLTKYRLSSAIVWFLRRFRA